VNVLVPEISLPELLEPCGFGTRHCIHLVSVGSAPIGESWPRFKAVLNRSTSLPTENMEGGQRMTRPLLFSWADARPHVGLGHLTRTCALAQAWEDAGGGALLTTGPLSARAEAIVRAAGVAVEQLPEHHLPTADGGANRFAAYASARGADWVSIDGYGIGIDAQTAVRAAVPRLAYIDDHAAGRRYDADLVIDQNLDAELQSRPEGSSDSLRGVRYAMLRRAFRREPASAGGNERLVALLGGAPDPAFVEFVERVLERVPDSVEVDVVGGHELLSAANRVTVHAPDVDVRSVLAGATVAFSAAGSTVWELCRAAVPSVLVAVAENQVSVGEALASRGAGRYLGRLDAVTPRDVSEAVMALFDDSETRSALAKAAVDTVDGCGAVRVATRLRSELIGLRLAQSRDVAMLFDWANDPDVRCMSFTSRPIEWDEHVDWFEARLRRSNCWSFIGICERGCEVGHVRFDPLTDGGLEIGISIDAAHRGRHLAAPLISAACRRIAGEAGARVVRARVRSTNARSARAFIAADFDHIACTVVAGAPTDVFEWRPRP
jgi:spore coat polysaccharide biosynthesis predicted glycosyltransferase SpsG/RimJ/RimL family protein N-acetyltransferase